ncbi:DMT family transporter [Pelagibius sp. 7325]|uniref:DMT family transporter n=1 Tax=Pelagibius sp. 7325 TaxID=3131994 RepID=UPI0030EC41B6
MSQRPSLHGDNVARAVGTIVLTVMALSLGDALIKLFSADFVLWQVFVLRSLVALPVLALIIGVRQRAGRPGLSRFLPRHPGWVALRSLMLTFMWVAYYAALPHLALSAAAAAYYTLPIFITLFAALFLGDRIGPLGWMAILLGFLGVLLVLRPDAGAFNLHALLPLAAAVLYALAMILTRSRCRQEDPLVLSLSLNVSFIAVGALATLAGLAGLTSDGGFLGGTWAPIGVSEAGALAVLAAAIIIGSVGAAIAYQIGPPATVASFDFAYVAFAGLWGLLFFSEFPDAISVLGMAMIVAGGLLAVRR